MAAQEDRRKKVVREFFELVIQGKPGEGLRFFSGNCKTHNPYIHGGMEALLEAMAAVQKEEPKYGNSDFTIRYLIAEGDIVAAHTELLFSKSKPAEGGLRQVHLFRFGQGDLVEEYWDVTQMVDPSMPNAEGPSKFIRSASL